MEYNTRYVSYTERTIKFPIFQEEYGLPQVFQQTRVSIFGHLPSFGAGENPFGKPFGSVGSSPALVAELKDKLLGHRDPVIRGFDYPDPFDFPHGPSMLLYVPKRLSIEEVITGAASALRTDQINYSTPAPTIQGDDYIWNAENSLEATFQATDSTAADALSNGAFLSGILFGIAASAAIALVQEIPGRIMIASSWSSWWFLLRRGHLGFRKYAPPRNKYLIRQSLRPGLRSRRLRTNPRKLRKYAPPRNKYLIRQSLRPGLPSRRPRTNPKRRSR